MKYDIAIIGSGVGGTFAGLRIAEKHDANTILIEIGKPPLKRRRFLEGFLGCLPTGDGKLYPGDLEKVKNLVDGRRLSPIYKWMMEYLKEVNGMKLIKSPKVLAEVKNRMKDNDFELSYHDYYQWKPESIHKLSKFVSEILERSKKITYSFDTEVYSLRKDKDGSFIIDSSAGTILAKKVILCVGRSGWRWVTNLYDDLGIISNDDYAKIGIRVELGAQQLKDFNRAHCSFIKDTLEIGPLCWNGTIIPEDHSDLVISAFRSNEDRWKSDKVSFSLLEKRFFKNEGSVQADRLGKLSFLLFNDRVSKEKIKTFLSGKSQLNVIPEYSWLSQALESLDVIIPNLCDKGYFHAPHIDPMAAQINIGKNLETEIDGLFVAGESAGISGILSAAIMGSLAADCAVNS